MFMGENWENGANTSKEIKVKQKPMTQRQYCDHFRQDFAVKKKMYIMLSLKTVLFCAGYFIIHFPL